MSVTIRKEYSTTDGINAGIKSVVSRKGKWNGDVQALAVACLDHVVKHGNWTYLARLVDGVSQCAGVNKTALKGWSEQAMHAVFGENDKGEPAFKYHDGHSNKTIDLEDAASRNWFDYKPPKKDTSKALGEIREAVIKMITASMKTDKLSQEEGLTLGEGFNTLVDGLVDARVEAQNEADKEALREALTEQLAA